MGKDVDSETRQTKQKIKQMFKTLKAEHGVAYANFVKVQTTIGLKLVSVLKPAIPDIRYSLG